MENGQRVLNRFKIQDSRFKIFSFVPSLFTVYYSLFTAVLLFTVYCLLSTVVNADIIDELTTKQKDIKTVKANFYQEKHTEILEKPIISKGIFYYSAPHSVRWEYTQNTPASSRRFGTGRAEHSNLIVIYDSKTLYLYYPDMKEADKLDIPSFMNFDTSFIKKNYDINYRADKSGRYTFILKPKVSTQISSIEMLFAGDKVFPEEVKIIEKAGDRTLIKFSDVTINKTLSEDLFKFIPEAGVKIRERALR